MEAATKSNRTLKIDGMSGDVCVQKVTGALKSVSDVTTHSVKVGSAEISADQNGSDAAVKAIGNAGYKSREHGADATMAGGSGSANLQANKAGSQSSPQQTGHGSQAEPKPTERSSMNPAAKPTVAHTGS